MPVNYAAAVKTARMTATRDAFANGTLEILDGATVLATFGLSASGGTVAGDTWTLVFDADTVVATASGTANAAQVKNSGGTALLTGLSVGVGSGDVSLNNTSINSGQNVTLNSSTIQHAT